MKLSENRLSAITKPSWLMLAAFLPLLLAHLRNLWHSDNFSHFPVVIGAFLYLLYRDTTVDVDSDDADTHRLWQQPAVWMTWALLLVAGVLLLLSAALWSPWVGTLAFVLTVLAVIAGSARRQNLWFFVPLWFILLMLLPPPINLAQRLTFALQGVASSAASSLLDLGNVLHVQRGYTLVLPEKSFLVEDACSGITSLFVIIAFAVILLVWSRRGLLHSFLLICLSVVWAVVANVLRITTVVVVYHFLGSDISEGLPHDLLGFAVFVVALALLASTDRLLLYFGESANLSTKTRKKKQQQENGLDAEPVPVWPLRSWLMAGAFALTIPLQIGPFLRDINVISSQRQPIASLLSHIDEDTLPERIGSWELSEFQFHEREPGSDVGDFSSSWRFTDSTKDASVSLDYPFIGWHQLTDCYRALGWEVGSWKMTSIDHEEFDADEIDVEVELTRPDGLQAYLLFSEFYSDLAPLSPPKNENAAFDTAMITLDRRLIARARNMGSQRVCLQFQVFVTSPSKLPIDEREKIQELYRRSRRDVVKKLQQAMLNTDDS